MWTTLAMYGVSGRLLRAVKALYENGKARVRVEDELTECFDVRQGTKQGCRLSPWLFNGNSKAESVWTTVQCSS